MDGSIGIWIGTSCGLFWTVAYIVANFVTSWEAVIFSKSTVLHGDSQLWILWHSILRQSSYIFLAITKVTFSDLWTTSWRYAEVKISKLCATREAFETTAKFPLMCVIYSRFPFFLSPKTARFVHDMPWLACNFHFMPACQFNSALKHPKFCRLIKCKYIVVGKYVRRFIELLR